MDSAVILTPVHGQGRHAWREIRVDTFTLAARGANWTEPLAHIRDVAHALKRRTADLRAHPAAKSVEPWSPPGTGNTRRGLLPAETHISLAGAELLRAACGIVETDPDWRTLRAAYQRAEDVLREDLGKAETVPPPAPSDGTLEATPETPTLTDLDVRPFSVEGDDTDCPVLRFAWRGRRWCLLADLARALAPTNSAARVRFFEGDVPPDACASLPRAQVCELRALLATARPNPRPIPAETRELALIAEDAVEAHVEAARVKTGHLAGGVEPSRAIAFLAWWRDLRMPRPEPTEALAPQANPPAAEMCEIFLDTYQGSRLVVAHLTRERAGKPTEERWLSVVSLTATLGVERHIAPNTRQKGRLSRDDYRVFKGTEVARVRAALGQKSGMGRGVAFVSPRGVKILCDQIGSERARAFERWWNQEPEVMVEAQPEKADTPEKPEETRRPVVRGHSVEDTRTMLFESHPIAMLRWQERWWASVEDLAVATGRTPLAGRRLITSGAVPPRAQLHLDPCEIAAIVATVPDLRLRAARHGLTFVARDASKAIQANTTRATVKAAIARLFRKWDREFGRKQVANAPAAVSEQVPPVPPVPVSEQVPTLAVPAAVPPSRCPPSLVGEIASQYGIPVIHASVIATCLRVPLDLVTRATETCRRPDLPTRGGFLDARTANCALFSLVLAAGPEAVAKFANDLTDAFRAYEDGEEVTCGR